MAEPQQKTVLVRVELTGLAMMRQRRTIEVPANATEEEVRRLALQTCNDHVWDYQGMDDSTVLGEEPS